MPRHRTLTSRSERQIRRNISLRGRNNSPSVVLDSNMILRDAFKCALNVIPNVFLSYDCGLMNLECRFCNAKHFESEVTLGDRTAFTSCCHNFTHTYDNVDIQLTKFWELEEISSQTSNMSTEDSICENLFMKTTTRDNDGRFSVRIPLRESADQLGDSYSQAESRFLALERKLGRCTPSYKKLYF